jgi:ResB-like family protein
VLRMLRTYRSAFYLIGTAFVLIAIRTLLTGKNALSAFDIAFSVYAFVLAAAITLSIIHRAKFLLANKITPPPNRKPHYFLRTPLPMDRIEKLLRSCYENGWHMRGDIRSGIELRKRFSRTGQWGSLVFHVALLVICSGLILSTLFSGRAMFALTEGQWLEPDGSALRSRIAGLFAPEMTFSEKEITLLDFEPRYRLGSATTAASMLRVKYEDTTAMLRAHVNQAVESGPWTIHQGDMWGYSTMVIITRADDRNLFRGFVRIATTVEGDKVHFVDSIKLDDGSTLQLTLYPDHFLNGGLDQSRSIFLNNPIIIAIFKQNGSVNLHGRTRIGDEISSAQMRIAFPGIRYWSEYTITYDPGISVIIIGAALALIGLLMRLLVTAFSLQIRLVKEYGITVVYLTGSSEKYRASFEEFLAAEFLRLQKALVNEEDRSQRSNTAKEHNMVKSVC